MAIVRHWCMTVIVYIYTKHSSTYVWTPFNQEEMLSLLSESNRVFILKKECNNSFFSFEFWVIFCCVWNWLSLQVCHPLIWQPHKSLCYVAHDLRGPVPKDIQGFCNAGGIVNSFCHPYHVEFLSLLLSSGFQLTSWWAESESCHGNIPMHFILSN